MTVPCVTECDWTFRSLDEKHVKVPEKIFSYLKAYVLARCCLVCVAWNKQASNNALWEAFDLTKEFPQLTIEDERSWQRQPSFKNYKLSFADLAPINKRAAIAFLAKTLPKLLASIESQETFDLVGKRATLITIPANLSLPIVEDIGKKPASGSLITIDYQNETRHIRDQKIEKGYRVLLAEDILQMTHMTEGEQTKLFCSEYIWSWGRAIETGALLVFRAQKEEFLYSGLRYTCCTDETAAMTLAIGGFYKNSFKVSTELHGIPKYPRFHVAPAIVMPEFKTD